MGPRHVALLCLASACLWVAEVQAGTRWRAQAIEIQVEPSLYGLAEDADEVAARVAQRWSVVEGAPALRVTSATRERDVGYDPREPTNSVTFAPEGSPIVGGALAITLLTYDAETLELLDADVIFNGTQRLLDVTRCERGEGDAAYDFESVLQHEFGHVLGLEEDLEHTEAVMYPYAAPWSTQSRTLKQPDEAALQSLYATPLPDQPAGCSARVASGGASIAVWNWAFALGLAGVAFARRRRRGWLGVVVVWGTLAVVSGGTNQAWAKAPTPVDPNVALALAYLEVVDSSARWEGGVLYTDLQLSTRDCLPRWCAELPNRLSLVGGSRDGVVQVLGHEPVPSVGAFLEVVAPPPRDGNRFKARHHRTVIKTKGGESLWIQ